MPRPARPRFDLRPLGHPVWWVALALLTANDHLFKQAGVLPGWLTGKLSDFAFLIVAPVLLGALLPVAGRARQAIALATVGALFAAAKISTGVSDLLVGALRDAGIVWRLWPDPTDLVAFAVIPITLSVMRGPTLAAASSRRRREQAGVVLGALACVATSAPPRYPHNPFLLNAAPDPTSFKITWLLRAVPCHMPAIDQPSQGSPIPADVAPALAASLTPGDLDDPFEVALASGQVAALDGEATTAGTCTTNTSSVWNVQCVGAILEAPSAAPVLMVALSRWEESDTGAFFSCDAPPSPTFRCKPMLNPKVDAGPDAVTLKTVGGVLQFVAGAKVRLAPVDLDAIAGRAPAPGSCRALREQYESLLQPQACLSDADCVAVDSVLVPGAPPVCAVNANLAGGRALSTLRSAWTKGCTSAPLVACDAPQPSLCREGACAAACPGEHLPSCPGPCYGDGGVSGSSCVQAGSSCVRPDGLVCGCTGGQTACGSPQPFSGTCPLACNNWPGGGSYVGGRIVHPSLDGGLDGPGAPPSRDGAGASSPDGGTDAGRD